MPLIPIANLSQISPGQPHACRAGERDLVLCRVDEQVYALDSVCPHVGGPLAHGTLHGRMLVCPWHAWEFDCSTGELDRNPACRIRTYAVTVRDGQVWVDLPDA